MPRRPRTHQPGSYHHLTAHGVDSRRLFEDDHDRWRFLGILGDVTRETGWCCLAACLMSTHYHVVVQEQDVPLSLGMRLLNGRYAVAFNARHARTGHLFNGRYRDTPIRDEPHLLLALRYVALNPVAAGLCERPEDWAWSSYAGVVADARGWSFVSKAATLGLFSSHRADAIERLVRFVNEVPGT